MLPELWSLTLCFLLLCRLHLCVAVAWSLGCNNALLGEVYDFSMILTDIRMFCVVWFHLWFAVSPVFIASNLAAFNGAFVSLRSLWFIDLEMLLGEWISVLSFPTRDRYATDFSDNKTEKLSIWRDFPPPTNLPALLSLSLSLSPLFLS